MPVGLVGRKVGMTRIFTEAGASIPVTIIHAEVNRVVRVKQAERDGYAALQVTVGSQKLSRLSKPVAGVYAKADVSPGRKLWEFRLKAGEVVDLAPNAELKVEHFAPGQKVDVTAISKGKGFAGTIKRHHFSSQDATHGNSLSHRAPGSIGQRQTPGRVFKGKRMAGHLGAVRTTTQNLDVIRIDVARNLLMIRGAVPGAPGGDVMIYPSVKQKVSPK